MTIIIRRFVLFVALSLVIFSDVDLQAGQERWLLDVSLKTLVRNSDTIFVGTLIGVAPENFKPANDKTDNLFIATNKVTFAIEEALMGEMKKNDMLTTKGGNLVLLYKGSKKFLVFLNEEDKVDFPFYPPTDVLPVINVESPDYHWDIGVRYGKRLPTEYGPYVNRFDMNGGLWMTGDKARWTPSLKKDVTKELVALDPQFADMKKVDEVFSLTTLGCHFTKDEWDRTPTGVGYIGPRPCPLPLAFVQAYVKVLVKRQEGKK